MNTIIGITADKIMEDGFYYEKVNESNLNAVFQHGGVPVILPITEDEKTIEKYLSFVDGIYFTGGGDINPLLFGEEPIRQIGAIDYDRDAFEVKLYKHAAAKNMPMLGICRGQQIMNIAAGGTLYQDIYTQRQNTNGHSPKFTFGGYEHHTVNLLKDSMIFNILKTDKIKTNSFHHQAVKDVADDYIATAFTEDGIIECIESVELDFALGIQWHPEIMFERYPVFCNIFISFIEASKTYSLKKN
ncbi:MAG: gamma-glutamyl-gamma-aminobutyrate hydrolase family protein [Sedimentibacter saalensis]|uniref:gamma-glutamyl-gamma-aminobutyrate hydrolase family protein n=1 Tax=Sedimentibacter saalensis TaxID=130788 RepID=UPI002B21E0D0|nr:gamma-glutamyl-gamma-aminobutyrate hydrolase family protein [Sedimentibacter saalensis]MEA5096421.1 gamma-glutamyl-gamma-aminobutyrate hydrolase family protein [Sedimentibacter saalensis]